MSRRAQVLPAPHRFTREEYHGMADLLRNERVELLDGIIMTMSRQNSPYTATVHRLLFSLLRILGPTAYVRVQAPLILTDWSEPEPDIAVCQPDPNDYAREHPQAHQVLLIIEVADTSLAYDRTQKASAYAAGGIPEYWTVNLNERRVEVRADPDPSTGRYSREKLAHEGEEFILPGGQTVAVSDILPLL
ncbi:MAG: Uma2 family endonuclease [Thermodesulfobacteriota bacterium]